MTAQPPLFWRLWTNASPVVYGKSSDSRRIGGIVATIVDDSSLLDAATSSWSSAAERFWIIQKLIARVASPSISDRRENDRSPWPTSSSCSEPMSKF
jgi:hypothetical protein